VPLQAGPEAVDEDAGRPEAGRFYDRRDESIAVAVLGGLEHAIGRRHEGAAVHRTLEGMLVAPRLTSRGGDSPRSLLSGRLRPSLRAASMLQTGRPPISAAMLPGPEGHKRAKPGKRRCRRRGRR